MSFVPYWHHLVFDVLSQFFILSSPCINRVNIGVHSWSDPSQDVRRNWTPKYNQDILEYLEGICSAYRPPQHISKDQKQLEKAVRQYYRSLECFGSV